MFFQQGAHSQVVIFSDFLVFPISTNVDITIFQYGKIVLYFFYNIAQKILTKEQQENDLELYQHGSWPISQPCMSVMLFGAHRLMRDQSTKRSQR